ncbi:hypothetical protein NFI96_032808 [Prochilodus magdalenae]|nr:hypothetical protein NFI96_032808 [Prochilodus magdalenae]
MADKPVWEQIGTGFVQHYYQQFDSDRGKLADLYTDASCLTWEGEGFQGKTAIMGKLSSLPFQTIQHSITAQDHHPTPDSCVMSMVMGQLKISSQCTSLRQSAQRMEHQSETVSTEDGARV